MATRLNEGLSRSGYRPHNHWIATRYDDRTDNIGFHSDKDRDFEDDSFFIVIKIGATRRFAFRLRGETRPFFDRPLPAGTAVFVRCKVTNQRRRDDGAPPLWQGAKVRALRSQERKALKAAGVISSRESPKTSRCVPRRSNAQAR